MSINWERAELAPDKSQKVEGRVLLDLRARINELEKELANLKEEFKKTQEQLKPAMEQCLTVITAQALALPLFV